jgi:hypothetical protein
LIYLIELDYLGELQCRTYTTHGEAPAKLIAEAPLGPLDWIKDETGWVAFSGCWTATITKITKESILEVPAWTQG